MTGYNSQMAKGEYKLQFETDNYDKFRYVEEAARLCVDNRHVEVCYPVVHGHWIVTDNGVNGKTADCSVCGAHFVYFKGHLQMDKMPGCPKCLSKMDEEVKKDGTV